MKLKKLSLKMPKGYSKSIHASVLILTLFGLMMIVSATANVNSLEWTRLVMVIVKESFFIVVSYIMMVTIARNFSLQRLKKLYLPILVFTMGALLATQFFGPVNGAKAWIHLGVASIQPSEFAKITVILVLAHSLGERERSKEGFWDLAAHPMTMIMIMSLIVLFPQGDLGTAMIMLLIALLTLLVFANSKLQKVQTLFLLLFVIYIVLIILLNNQAVLDFLDAIPFPDRMHYMINRIKTSANPFLDRYNAGAQIFNGLAAFVSGGLWGVGYGKGFLKFSFIYAAESDSILAVIVEELGVIFGFMPIVLFYGVIFYQLMKYTFLVKSEKDKAILVGTLSYFFIHFLLNVGGVTALIPLTGVPLLFISAGGSSRMAVMIAIGLSQNVIARYRSSQPKELS